MDRLTYIHLDASNSLGQVTFRAKKKVINHHMSGNFGQQPISQVTDDEPGATTNQNNLARKTNSYCHNLTDA